MFRWPRVLVCAAIVSLPLLPASSTGNPIRVNFTASADPTDPTLVGATSTGYFIFDSSIIPYGGGTVSSGVPPGLQLSAISFSWDGQSWTAANACSQILTFGSDGALIGWNLQAQVSPGYVVGGTLDFAFDVSPTGSTTFSYSRPSAPGVYAGSVVTWDAASLPIIVGSWFAPGAGNFALDSFGRIYSYIDRGCLSLASVSIIGNLFNGPPPSPVVGMMFGGGNSVFATLENGDIWRLCPPETNGQLIGNIFQAPGIAAVPTQASPAKNTLALPRPNPFNPVAEIPYTVATPGRVSLRIFDARGRLVRTLEDGRRPAGSFVGRWDGKSDSGISMASGTYFGRITFPDGTTSERKLTILK